MSVNCEVIVIFYSWILSLPMLGLNFSVIAKRTFPFHVLESINRLIFPYTWDEDCGVTDKFRCGLILMLKLQRLFTQYRNNAWWLANSLDDKLLSLAEAMTVVFSEVNEKFYGLAPVMLFLISISVGSLMFVCKLCSQWLIGLPAFSGTIYPIVMTKYSYSSS